MQSQKDSVKDWKRVKEEHIKIADAVISDDSVQAKELMQLHVVGSLGRRAISVLSPDEH